MSVVNLLSKYLGFEEPSGFVYQTLAPGISVPQPEGRDVCDEKGPPKFEWDDKGLKAFYEDLIELKTVIPEPEDAQSAAKDDSRCTKDDPQNADEDDLQNNAMEDAQSSAEKAAVDEAIDSKMVFSPTELF